MNKLHRLAAGRKPPGRHVKPANKDQITIKNQSLEETEKETVVGGISKGNTLTVILPCR